ncbi:MAG TPA: serine/threonine protein kinase, partial [Fibrobacteraceae bacterium]|nr:serine/threonine protein kinase [Fibrobacteraceae bacterium]
MIRTILSEALDRLSRRLTLRPHFSQQEYQYWIDRNPAYLPNDAVDRVRLLHRLNMGGTNDVFLANNWIERHDGRALNTPREIVVKICKYWAPPGRSRHHRLNMILGAFQDEIRINNLVRATNVEGVVQSFGGGQA